jgi:hypothetical protein
VKGLLYFLFFIAVVVGLYLYLHKEENFEIKDRIIVSQSSGMDINVPITAPPKFAVIKGTIKNISNKNFSNVEVFYQSGSDTVRAVIGSLSGGQSTDFQTNHMRVITNRPDYKLINISYVEE